MVCPLLPFQYLPACPKTRAAHNTGNNTGQQYWANQKGKVGVERRRDLHLQANLPEKASSDTAPNPVKPNMQKWYLQFYDPPKKYFPLLKDAINFPSMRVF